jgi:hypothetical protein
MVRFGGDVTGRNRIDPTTAHPARRYNYWLGGKDNFAADRASGDAIAAAMPTVRLAARENRMFLRRAVRFLAEQGITQFLDIGTGIPTADNTHEVAQAVDPAARVVYVDNDPIVLSHARALLTSTPEGATGYLDADLRDPADILARKDLHATLDLSRPVALMLVAILHFIRDDEHPREILSQLVAALPAGSYVTISHVTWDHLPPHVVTKLDAANPDGRFRPRTIAELTALLDGLEPVDPGLVSIADWRAERERQPRPAPADVSCVGAVLRVPGGRPLA